MGPSLPLLAKPGYLHLLDKPTGFSPSPEREFLFFLKVGSCPAPCLLHLAGHFPQGQPHGPPGWVPRAHLSSLGSISTGITLWSGWALSSLLKAKSSITEN